MADPIFFSPGQTITAEDLNAALIAVMNSSTLVPPTTLTGDVVGTSSTGTIATTLATNISNDHTFTGTVTLQDVVLTGSTVAIPNLLTVGSVVAADFAQFPINTGALRFVNGTQDIAVGPTIGAIRGTTVPTILESGGTIVGVHGTNDLAVFQGHTLSEAVAIESFGGTSAFLTRRGDGNSGAPTIPAAGAQVGRFAGDIYIGGTVGWSGPLAGMRIALSGTPSTSNYGSLSILQAVQQGTTVLSDVGFAEVVNDGTSTFSNLRSAGRMETGQLKRTTTAAVTGYVGEYVSNSMTVTGTSGVALTSGTIAALGSIVLTAGDWDIYGALVLDGQGATTVTSVNSSIATTGTVLSTTPGRFVNANMGTISLTTFGGQMAFNIIGNRVTAAATYWLNAKVSFAAGTLVAGGLIEARRR